MQKIFYVLIFILVTWTVSYAAWNSFNWSVEKWGSSTWGVAIETVLTAFNVTDNGGEVFRVTDNGGEDFNVK